MGRGEGEEGEGKKGGGQEGRRARRGGGGGRGRGIFSLHENFVCAICLCMNFFLAVETLYISLLSSLHYFFLYFFFLA